MEPLEQQWSFRPATRSRPHRPSATARSSSAPGTATSTPSTRPRARSLAHVPGPVYEPGVRHARRDLLAGDHDSDSASSAAVTPTGTRSTPRRTRMQWSVFAGAPTRATTTGRRPPPSTASPTSDLEPLRQPLVQGQLLRVNLADRRRRQHLGGRPRRPDRRHDLDHAGRRQVRNKVYVTTGNRAYDSSGNNQKQAESMVAVDATTLAVKDYWSLPVSDPTPDADWGTSPVFLKDAQGRDLVAAGNKNGRLYAFHRDAIGFGPVWSRQFAIRPRGRARRRRALLERLLRRPAAVLGRRTHDGRRADRRRLGEGAEPDDRRRDLGAAAPDEDVRVVDHRQRHAGRSFAEGAAPLDPATGEVLYENPLTLYGAAKIASGRLYIGDYEGTFHAYTFPYYPGPARARRRRNRAGQGCQDRQPGSPGPASAPDPARSDGAPATVGSTAAPAARAARCARQLARRRQRGREGAEVDAPPALGAQLARAAAQAEAGRWLSGSRSGRPAGRRPGPRRCSASSRAGSRRRR